MKKGIVLLFVFLILGGVIGCASVSYRNDISCAAITDKITDALSVTGGYDAFETEHLRFYFENTTAYDEQHLVYSAVSEDINEIGVFHAGSVDEVNELKRLCEAYLLALSTEQRAFIASYAPEEVTKLDHAEVRIYGDYVIYTVLSPKDRETAWEIVEQLLKE